MNILDYLDSAFESFDERGVGPVDSLIWAQLSMVKLDGIVPELYNESHTSTNSTTGYVKPHDLLRAEKFDHMLHELYRADDYQLMLYKLAANPRMRDLHIWGYHEENNLERQMQFGAVSITCPDRFTAIAFRGTDGSFVGWREDFNMGFMWPVAGQTQAVTYLESIAAQTDLPLYVLGHSKGGNLAAFSALKCSDAVRDRIVAVYDHDGPGFREQAVTNEERAALGNRLHKYVPNESVVGMLMETNEDALTVVDSDEHGVIQHDPFSWQIEGMTGDFVLEKSLSSTSRLLRQTFIDWMARYDDKQLEQLVDAIFDTLISTGAKDVHDLGLGNGITSTISYLAEAAKNLQDPERSILLDAIGQFTSTMMTTTRDAARDAMSDAVSGLIPNIKYDKGTGHLSYDK